MNGVPCVTSSLPGVRQPVRIHQMGEIFPIGDSDALAEKLIRVIANRKTILEGKRDFSCYQPDSIAQAYEDLFQDIQQSL